MRATSAVILSVAFLALASNAMPAQDYFTKDGKLTQQLKVVQLQGGFAGSTGVQYTIAPDGSWNSEGIFNQKITPKSKGKLSEKDLAKLGAALEKYDIAKLPAKSGKPPGANPHTITIEFGNKKASLVGQTPPELDPKNPTGTVESRFAGTWEAVVGLLAPKPSPKEEKKESQDVARDKAIKKDRQQIEGTWRVVTFEVDGNKGTEEEARKLAVVNGSDGSWSLRSEDRETNKGTSTIDPTKSPKTIDFTITEGQGNGNQHLGIYELGANTRKLCFAAPGKERPTEFTTIPGSGHIFVTFEREKAKQGGAGPIVDGLQLTLSAANTETLFPKDGKNAAPIALKLTFTNVSDKAIKFNAFDFYFSRIKGDVKAMPADSMTSARAAADRKPFFPKGGDFPELKPGATWSFDQRLAFPGAIPQGGSKLDFCSVVKPGEFRIQFAYNSDKGIDSPLANGVWTGALLSNEIVITVKK